MGWSNDCHQAQAILFPSRQRHTIPVKMFMNTLVKGPELDSVGQGAESPSQSPASEE